MDLQGKKVLTIGAGLSGFATCQFLLAHGAKVTLSDAKSKEQLGADINQFANHGVELLLSNLMPSVADWDLCIKSPGVPPTIPLVEMVKAAGIEMISEIELAYLFAASPIIAITGTNGKTTTTALTGYILSQAGINTLVGGNIGTPLIEHIENYQGMVVAEVSSFQLEDCYEFKPHIAAMLNISPDHQDRHGSMAVYQQVKERIFARQDRNDLAILNYDDDVCRGIGEKLSQRTVFFSTSQLVNGGIYLDNGQIILDDNGHKINIISVKDIYIKGHHNWQNAMAAAAAAYYSGVAADDIANALHSFPGVEHRMEFVCERNGISFVNDSKGTNPDSTQKALLSYQRPLILIAGGRNKGNDFAPLMGLIKDKVRKLIILGEATDDIRRAADNAGFKDYILAGGFDEAVRSACQTAQRGDLVLLSPACASWDMFKNYEERGNRFKQIVKDYGEE